MGNVKKQLRQRINKAAANFLCESQEGDLYDAYLELKNAQKIGHGNDYATDWVDLPENQNSFNTVDQVVDLIECAVHNEAQLPEFLANVDWPLLKSQKQDLLKVIGNMEEQGNSSADALNGILNFIDSIQDYVVDTCGLDENLVFELSKDDDECTEGYHIPQK